MGMITVERTAYAKGQNGHYVIELVFRLVVGILLLFCFMAAAVGGERPAELPESYRDFKIYATSKPDPDDEGHIVM